MNTVQRELCATSGCHTRSREWKEGGEICDSDMKVRCTMLAFGNQKRQMR